MNKYQIRAKRIPVLPEIVTFDNIKDAYGKTDELIIGIEKESLEMAKYNFKKNFTTIISGNDNSLFNSFINPLINQILSLNSYIDLLFLE